MGSLYRSELMSLCQVFLQADSAFEAVAKIGELGMCQFIDLNEEVSNYARKFITEVRRCEGMERNLNTFREEIESHDIDIPDVYEHIPAPLPREMGILEANFEKIAEELESINGSTAGLRANFIHLHNTRYVLKKVRQSFEDGQRTQALHSISEHQHIESQQLTVIADEDKLKTESELRIVAGVIDQARVLAFERVLWRLCRGNVYVRTSEVPRGGHPLLQDEDPQSAFLLFFSGEQLRNKVIRICESFRASIIPVPESEAQRGDMTLNVNAQLEDMVTVVDQTLEHRDRVLRAAAENLKVWEIKVLKLKAIFHTLNKFNIDVTQKCLIAECWIPTDDITHVRLALAEATKLSGSTVTSVIHQLETNEMRPTFHRTNKFTRGFQNIVDSYGIANYREVNPAPWTIITFPFIFAIMFGDTGHGIIMFISALLLVLFEAKIERAKIKDEIFNTFYGGRYVILLMGLFSCYTGLIYNDVYSRSIDIFGSQWKNPYNTSILFEIMSNDANAENKEETKLQLPPYPSFDDASGPYPFGLDPIWNLADNKLNFLNPMKMKSSVIIGIAQMTFGLSLSLLNHLHNKSVVDVVFVFIPQLLFLSLIFIYLCAQIVLKWVFFWVRPSRIFGYLYPGSNCAPSLLIGLINMFMVKSRTEGFVIEYKNGSWSDVDQCHQQQWYPHQGTIEKIFLLVAVLCIPIMLLVKPFYQRALVARGQHVEFHSDSGHGEFNFADVMVYQAIHTIEFVLGCISHTASYLRLWALSLAHAQLSEVLWEMVLRMAFHMKGIGGIIAVFIIFFLFAILSICILILMEGLSAFLHAIRLHWVEFQSKFYGGAGIQFEPFSFYRLIRVYEGLED
uniref:V-type proton ATPase subunit a n=1 Tax=Panagrellus redivivus TaxID=6233 RepID=A0A7E4ZT50_PANRE